MQTVTTRMALACARAAIKSGGKTLALVPTMGALHDGHLTLVRAAREVADAVVVSIFVNPLQFGANEDLDAYPRQLAADAALLAAEGVALLWAPDLAEMYPEGFASKVSVGGIDQVLCGSARPGHFDGVASVVLKLFNQVRPDVALFGEKDWQQLAVIRRMACDLDLTSPAADRIVGVPTVREADGLAMSSRNRYLDRGQREQAAGLNRAMRDCVAAIAGGAAVAPALAQLVARLEHGGFHRVDYAELRDPDRLQPTGLGPAGEWDGQPARLFVAARIGPARLIDNIAVVAPTNVVQPC